MVRDLEESVVPLKLHVHSSTVDEIRGIIELVGFGSIEEFLRIALKKELDRYRILFGMWEQGRSRKLDWEPS
jgi:hypothetical protein